MLIAAVQVIAFVIMWVGIGMLGQSCIDIKSFPYIMLWGAFAMTVSGVVSELIARELKRNQR